LTDKISKQTDLLKEINFSQNSEETKRYPWAIGQDKTNTHEKFTKRSTSESMLEYHQQLDRDAKEILLPKIGEDDAERRHRSEIRRRIGTYQRFGQTLTTDEPLEQRGNNCTLSQNNERSLSYPQSPITSEPTPTPPWILCFLSGHSGSLGTLWFLSATYLPFDPPDHHTNISAFHLCLNCSDVGNLGTTSRSSASAPPSPYLLSSLSLLPPFMSASFPTLSFLFRLFYARPLTRVLGTIEFFSPPW
jgi:hypothetical protein